nr:MarR family winged helix-turn-helix transcriptional regulator [uncultured Gellertiella sp.]
MNISIDMSSSTVEDGIGYWLRRAQQTVLHDFSETFASYDLRPAEFSLLMLLGSQPGIKQSDAAEILGIQRANFVALVDALQQRGLAERRKPDSDRRVQALFLTRQGTDFVVETSSKWRQHEARIIARLGGIVERDQLVELLTRLSY